MQGCGNQEWLPAETKLQGLAGWQSWGGPAGGSGSMGVLIAQRRRADVMSVRRCWHHSWKVSWKIEQGDVEMEKESKLREVGLAGTTQEAAFGLTCRLTVLSSSASQPFMHQLPQGGVWERRVRREKRGVRSGSGGDGGTDWPHHSHVCSSSSKPLPNFYDMPIDICWHTPGFWDKFLATWE